ncbi:GH22273 [Drosophila grimshawi]|uniref:GH22273 n=1 Tax=Drosophila grimshawi TaxID=7222 RepID=B4JZ33_DROGR|nr:GH22273 [Drosophila grimshawi]
MWSDSPKEDVRVYKLDTVTYDTKPASFLDVRSMQQLAVDEAVAFPIGRSRASHTAGGVTTSTTTTAGMEPPTVYAPVLIPRSEAQTTQANASASKLSTVRQGWVAGTVTVGSAA